MLSDSEHNDCVVFDDQGQSLKRMRALAARLPFQEDDCRPLLERHCGEEAVVERFCCQHAEQLQTSTLLLWLGEQDIDDMAVDRVQLEHCHIDKAVYRIGRHKYCFLDQNDAKTLAAMPREVRDAVWALYGKRFVRITGLKRTVVKSEHSDAATLTEYDHNRPQKKQRLDRDDECIALNVQLAQAKCEAAHREEMHRKEMELMKTKHELELKTKEAEVLSAHLTTAQYAYYYQEHCLKGGGGVGRRTNTTPLLTMGSPSADLALDPNAQYTQKALAAQSPIKTVADWLSNKYFPQQDYTRVRWQKQHRYAALFDDKIVKQSQLQAHVSVHACREGRLFILVPMTYLYNLRFLLELLQPHMEERGHGTQMRLLLEHCPRDARVMLRFVWADLDNIDAVTTAMTSSDNQMNVTALLLHCHAFVQVHRINTKARATLAENTEKGKRSKEKDVSTVHLITHHPQEIHPSLTLLERLYPSPQHCGMQGSYVTTWLGLRMNNPTFVKPRKNGGAKKSSKKSPPLPGSGKACPFCWTGDRMQAADEKLQLISHHASSCPVMALLSDNEAAILMALRQACTATPGNEARADRLIHDCEYLFGSKNGTLQLGEQTTYFRHATPTEIQQGQHVGGLRVNEEVRDKQCEKVQEMLKTQRDNSKLLGPLEPTLFPLVQTLLPDSVEVRRAWDLLRFSDGSPYIVKTRRFNTPEERLYFTLQECPRTQAEEQNMRFVENELAVQRYAADNWLANPVTM